MLAVTGCTGELGRLVLRRLYERGANVVLLARNIEKARSQQPKEYSAQIVDVRHCVFGDPAGCAQALRAIKVLFFVSATEDADRVESHRAFVDAAASAGVEHIVYTSFRRAGPKAVFLHARDHYLTEEYIKAKIPHHTMLRNAFYYEVLPLLVSNGAIRGPAGNGTLSPVAKADIAEVAATVLLAPARFTDQTFELTGPEDLPLADAARIIGARYAEETEDGAWETRRKEEDRDWLIAAWISTYTAIREGEESGVSGDVQAILGRPPISLAEWFKRLQQ